MAYEYKVAPIDLEGVAKAYSETASQIMKFRIQQDESIRKSIDNEYRMLSGKIRKVDLGDFDQKFSTWESNGKQAMRLNRGGNRQELTAANISKDDARKDLYDYIGKSNSIAGRISSMGKLYKDPTKILDSQKYQEVYGDLNSLSVSELEEKYGSLDNIPSDFDFKLENFDVGKVAKLNNSVKSRLPIEADKYFREAPAIDPATGKQKTKPLQIEYAGKKRTINVPLIKVFGQVDPSAVVNSAILTTVSDPESRDYLRVSKKELMTIAADPNNPSSVSANELLQSASRIFNQPDISKLDEYQIYAAGFINENTTKDIEIPDWNTLGQEYQQFARENNLKMDALQEQRLRKSISDSAKAMTLGNLSTLFSIYKNARDTGLTNDDNFANTMKNVLGKYGVGISLETIKNGAKGIVDQDKLLTELLIKGITEGKIQGKK